MSRSHAVLLCIFWILCASEDAKWFKWSIHVCVRVLTCAHLCLTVCDAVDCSPPGGSLHRIFLNNPEYWSRLPFPPLEDLPNSGIEPLSLAFPTLASRFFTTAPLGKPVYCQYVYLSVCPIFLNTFKVSRKYKICPLMWWMEHREIIFFFFNENMVFVYIVLSQCLFRVRSS